MEADERYKLTCMLRAIEGDEAKGRATKRLSLAVRYDLAVRAADLNGDGCRFPKCGCLGADCSKGRMSLDKPYGGAEWDNRRRQVR